MKYTKRDSAYNAVIIIFFLVWPLVTTLISLFNSVSVSAKRFVTVAFSAIIGYNIYCFDVSGDSAHYVEHFIDYLNFGLNIKDTFASGRIDVFSSLSYWFVGSITKNPHVLYAFWGALYGFFMFESCRLMTKHKGVTSLSIVIISLLFFINGLGNLGAVRFHLAVWYFFCFFIRYIEKYETKWLFFLFLSPLIHTTFLLPCAVTLCYRYFSFNVNVLTFFLIIAFIAGHILPVGEYMGTLDYLADNENYSKYVSDDYMNNWDDTIKRMSLAHQVLMILPEYLCFMIILIIQPCVKKCQKEKKNIFNLYKFVIIMYSFSSLFVSVPNMGRFKLLSYMVLLLLLYQIFSEKVISFKSLYPLLLCLVFLYFIYMTYYDMSTRFEQNYLYPLVYLGISSK